MEIEVIMSVFRIYSEKKPEFAVEAQSVLSDIKTALRLDIKNIRVLNRYDADRLTEEDFNAAISTGRDNGFRLADRVTVVTLASSYSSSEI